MNSKAKLIITFVLGAGVGSAVTWKLLKTKYEQIAQEEIDSVKEVYSRRHQEDDSVIDGSDSAPVEDGEDGEIIEETMYIANGEPVTSRRMKVDESVKMEYSSISELYNKQDEKGGSDDMIFPKPYVISANDFEDGDEFEKEYLNYYADDILTDDFGEVISDIEDVIGTDAIEQFENNDVVYVRNERLMRDYEICLDNKCFSELDLTDDE